MSSIRLIHLKGTVPAQPHPAPARATRRSRDLMEREQTVFTVTDDRRTSPTSSSSTISSRRRSIDADGRLVGMLMVDDIVDVIQEEAEEDILHLGGVGGGGDDLRHACGRRRGRASSGSSSISLTAILASWVISWFDATIDQMVALAVLMPIVASMGGNAGTQTMTVAVRALATRDLGPLNALQGHVARMRRRPDQRADLRGDHGRSSPIGGSAPTSSASSSARP